MNVLETVLSALNLDVIREDAKSTAVLSRQLEVARDRTYDIVYPEMKARELIPTDNSVDPGAKTVTYAQWSDVGMAAILANYATDLPAIDALVEEFTSPIHGIGGSYFWSIQDIRAAALSGSDLPARKGRAARRAIEVAIENIAANGNAKVGLQGLTTNANVAIVSPTTGTWAGATGAQMVGDMNKFVTSMVTTNLETFLPDTIILDIASFQLFSTTRISTTGDTHTTAMQAFLASNPYVKNVKSWNRLALADAGGTGPRAICYKKDPEVLELIIPQEYEEMPPQANGLKFSVPAHARCGGVVIYYPIGLAYMDGL